VLGPAWLCTIIPICPIFPGILASALLTGLPPDACRAYGIEGWEHIDKETIAKDIGEGRWHTYGQAAVFEYCEEDVRKSTQLLRRQLRGNAVFPPVEVPLVLYWSEYSASRRTSSSARHPN